jgi:hypothetical protein
MQTACAVMSLDSHTGLGRVKTFGPPRPDSLDSHLRQPGTGPEM